MHIIQEKLLALSRKDNLAGLSLRQMGTKIGMPGESPQKIKHHLLQLQKRGFLVIDRIKGVMDRTALEPGWAKGLLKKASRLFSIPVVGTASCGPNTIFAETNFEGFVRVSSKLVERSKPTGLYAVRADGSSMNRAEINGKQVEDGDYIIIDSKKISPINNDVVLVIIDNKAVVKRFFNDQKNEQIVLRSDSSFDYDPIYLHPNDGFYINGTAISVMKQPVQ